jgi:HNH endonuclease
MDRPPIPSKLKRLVLVEAGHRCAIPTCRVTTTEIAHIVPFSKNKEHKFENLIALCPNCHTRYDKGEIDRLSMFEYKKNLKTIHLNFSTIENSGLDITLWCEYENDDIIFHVENNSNQPLLDFILYVDKIYKTELELIQSSHTLEILYGTIPANRILTHTDILISFGDAFGFPILTGQFSDKKKKHWAVNENFNITEIKFRNPFD